MSRLNAMCFWVLAGLRCLRRVIGCRWPSSKCPVFACTSISARPHTCNTCPGLNLRPNRIAQRCFVPLDHACLSRSGPQKQGRTLESPLHLHTNLAFHHPCLQVSQTSKGFAELISVWLPSQSCCRSRVTARLKHRPSSGPMIVDEMVSRRNDSFSAV